MFGRYFVKMDEANDGEGGDAGPGGATDEAAAAAAAAAEAEAAKDGKESADAKNDTDGGKQSGDAGEKETGAPEKYEAFNVPEGLQLDQQAMDKFVPIAKELGLTQDGAQKTFDFANTLVLDAVSELADVHKSTVSQWETEAKADKDIGGANFDANVALAKKGMEHRGGPELVKLFEDYGLNANPLVIRAFRDIGKDVSDDTLVNGKPSGGTTEEQKLARRYPSMAQK